MKFLKLTLAFFALFISAAHAQIGVDAGAFSGGTVTNPIAAPSFNATGTAGYQIGGLNGLFVTNGPANQQGIFVGPGAGLLGSLLFFFRKSCHTP